MSIRVVVADDHPVFRIGLEQVLSEAEGIELVGSAADGESALELIDSKQPEVAVLDISMPDLSGFEVLKQARQRGVQTRFVVLTLSDDEGYLKRALSLGAYAYVLKDDAIARVVDAVRAAARGESWVSEILIAREMDSLEEDDSFGTAMSLLTPAERRIIALLSGCLTSAEIAQELSLSVRTVQNHRTNICTRLNLRGAHKLLEFAIEHRSRLQQYLD